MLVRSIFSRPPRHQSCRVTHLITSFATNNLPPYLIHTCSQASKAPKLQSHTTSYFFIPDQQRSSILDAHCMLPGYLSTKDAKPLKTLSQSISYGPKTQPPN
eukprot:1161921-Pelagomonas_calceolata.AAC.10